MHNYLLKLKSKIIVTFDIFCKTGLHIGGTSGDSGIGDVDMAVIKNPENGAPYIPGSSLKGRMREQLEWLEGNVERQVHKITDGETADEKARDEILAIKACECGTCEICHYFGYSTNNYSTKELILGPTRILFRDAFPKDSDGYNQIDEWKRLIGEEYTEMKVENTISRLTAVAVPRTLERVPAGSRFSGEVVIDLYEMAKQEKKDSAKVALKLIMKGLRAIEYSSFGGKGSRGSGKVEFKSFRFDRFPLSYFTEMNQKKEMVFAADAFNENDTATKLCENLQFDTITE